MKQLLYTLFAILLCACADILEEKPQAIAVETFYNSAGEVEAGIAAIYSPLRSGSAFGAIYPALLDISSDMLLSGRASWAPASKFEGLNGTAITRAQGVWGQFYLSIRNANLIIQNIPNSSKLNDADKNKYIGEAKFMRAFVYFQLVRCWGAVPLRTEANFSELSVPRSPVEEIYKQIISDLEFSEANLPETVPVAGHPTKYSAKSLLADAYFHSGNNQKAAEKSQEVIKSGKYSLVEVTVANDFEKLFGSNITTSTEEIFYLKYSEKSYWEYPIYMHGVGSPHLGIDGYFVHYSNKDYISYKNWDNNDLRKVYGWYLYSGFDPGTILCKKFNDPGSKTPKNDYPLYRYADCLLIYAEASCRASGSPTVDGMEALNKVHRRAYGYPSAQPSPVDYILANFTKDSFIETCIKERGYETIGEGKRWLDLKRTGKAAEYIKATRGLVVQEKHYLWPIPVSELNYNDAITDQNPGY